ncbi:4-hydroxythreonine-4-phosphate dehydrogenase PdxA [Neorhizobium sp. P12A]|uniref:4-hydroxythreonine-4-phosphate dehydrogenase PdxA n=1 Tax=Rhizobium/Agrobacterium group TaxID=227290 RepID=UPI00104371B4|nr:MULTISPECIES: 4-hydroxythreonine-4-phosphate dehydrogenase PdxA [Rhizobium/Agrobacterium group]KAA0697786.1 4-hydroxythreonine-4-phosphate dehydrogenase PdxA [Neorhizobium sp. P12A]TCR88016.1 4-hydroxythreonine-4-phosphate dehydrogenase [Rhizobium sp. BK376]
MTKPIIAITMGDPAGIGPEVIAKALSTPAVENFCRPFVVGDVDRLRKAAAIVGTTTEIRLLDAIGDRKEGSINVLQAVEMPSDLPFGAVSREGGEAAYRCIVSAVEHAQAGTVDAICTAPLSKEALHLAGYRYPGHTELIAHLTSTAEVSMMLASPKLRVVHVTTHIGLIDAIAKIEPGLVLRTIERGRAALLGMMGREPRIGVCAINPHAGENGLFGHDEEAIKITPAVTEAVRLGYDVTGPLAADTLFFRAVRGDFDLVVAMYHDQGHGPVKVLGIEEGVNVTVGLPIVRTSVDHGTAFDIAGMGKADERSLIYALQQAAILSGKAA